MNIEKIEEIISTLELKSRQRIYLYPRIYLMHYIRHNYGLSYASIGILFGGFDHATVLHACNTHKNLTSTRDNEYKTYTRNIVKRLSSEVETLESSIINCTTLKELKIIQDKVKSNPSNNPKQMKEHLKTLNTNNRVLNSIIPFVKSELCIEVIKQQITINQIDINILVAKRKLKKYK